MLLGLDLSTVATGWALGDEGSAKPRCGTWRMPGAADDVFDRTLIGLQESIENLCALAEVRHVVIEAPLLMVGREASAHTAAALMQLTGAARAAAKRKGAEIRLYAVSTVRKHFIGTGRHPTPKRAVMDRCRRLEWKFDTDNAADACALWCYGMSVFYPRWPQPALFFPERVRA